MAITILGETRCVICGELIDEKRPFRSFPAFVVNENDPIYLFSDGVCHDDCFANHYLKKVVMERLEEWEVNTGPGNRKCAVYNEEIMDPDDYLMIDHLTSDESNPVFRYNYTHLRKSHLGDWRELEKCIEDIKKFKESTNWGGGYLEGLIESLNSR